MTPPSSTTQEAQQAILDERMRRDYQVTIAKIRRSYAIAGIRIPEELEAYVAETRCTVHEVPCLWADWCFRIGDHFRVVLFNDLFRPGMLVEQSVQVLFKELQQEQRMSLNGGNDAH